MRQIKISITREHGIPELWPRAEEDSSASEPTILILPADFAVWYVLDFLGKAGVEETDQAVLLGVPVGRLRHYRRRTSVPRPEVLARITELLRCQMALPGIFVDARDRSYRWFTACHRRFAPQPVAYMKRHGIQPVRRYLEQRLRSPIP